MYQDDQRHQDGEFLVLRLMAEEVHACPGTEAAPNGCNEEKRLFRDAPLPFLRLVLVDKKHAESDDVCDSQVDDDNTQSDAHNKKKRGKTSLTVC